MQMHGSEESAALYFPEHSEEPETKAHLELRTLLYLFLKQAFATVAKIGSEQFVYWDPTDPRACLAPDAFVRFGSPDDRFRRWNVWEHGAPHVAVEILSHSDRQTWEQQLDGYRRMGVCELVFFDAEFVEQPLRIWDFAGHDLLERKLHEPYAKSMHLGGYWLPVEVPGEGLTLRLSHDTEGENLFLTHDEIQTRRADLAEQEVRALRALLAQNR